MKNRLFAISIAIITVAALTLSSCVNTSPSESIIKVIDTVENKLYSNNSLEEMSEMQHSMLKQITSCLDSIHRGYRFNENDEEYDKVMKRLERYNIVYCGAISRFNPELDLNKGNKDKIARLLAIMKTMENRALTKLDGFNPSEEDSELTGKQQYIFPTKSEIEQINAQLPTLVAEGTLCTKVKYDDHTKVQTFYYRFTQEVDESMITTEVIQQLKINMVSELKKDANNVRRLKAGMKFRYIYYSIDNRQLYKIIINSNDISN